MTPLLKMTRRVVIHKRQILKKKNKLTAHFVFFVIETLVAFLHPKRLVTVEEKCSEKKLSRSPPRKIKMHMGSDTKIFWGKKCAFSSSKDVKHTTTNPGHWFFVSFPAVSSVDNQLFGWKHCTFQKKRG